MKDLFIIQIFLFEIESLVLAPNLNLKLLKQSLFGALNKFFKSTKLLILRDSDFYDKDVERNGDFANQLFHFDPHSPVYIKKHQDFIDQNIPMNINEDEDEPEYKLKSNTLFFNYAKKLIRKLEEQGIQVIFFNSPGGDFSQTKASFENFIQENQYVFIETTSSSNPSLYTRNNFFDARHLNKSGSWLFSNILHEKFLDHSIKKVNKGAL